MDGWGVATAIGTIAAAVVPGGLYLLERRDRMLERQDRIDTQAALDRERQERLDEERHRVEAAATAEVRKVMVRSDFYYDLPPSAKGGDRNVVRAALRARVVNRSPNVVFDVTIHSDELGTSKYLRHELIPAGTVVGSASALNGNMRIADGAADDRLVYGETEYDITDADGSTGFGPPDGWEDEVRRRVWVEFTDVAQQRWARYEDGEVRRLDPYQRP